MVIKKSNRTQLAIIVVVGVLIIGLVFLFILNMSQPVTGGISGYRCELVGDKIRISDNAIIFPKSGSCNFIEENASNTFFAHVDRLSGEKEFLGSVTMETRYVLDDNCKLFVADIVPAVASPANSGLPQKWYGIFSDFNGNHYACLGLPGV